MQVLQRIFLLYEGYGISCLTQRIRVQDKHIAYPQNNDKAYKYLGDSSSFEF